MIYFSFVYPKLLLLLFLIPLFVLFYFLSLYFKNKKAINFPNFEAMQRVFGVEIFSKNFLALFLNMVVLVFMIFAISGTSFSFDSSSGSSYALAIDGSMSMNTSDILPSRIAAAKSYADNFIDSLPINAEVSVVEFSDSAKILQYPDISKTRAKMAVDSIVLSGNGGTNFQDLLLTVNLALEKNLRKTLVLISDGQINVGNLDELISYAKNSGIVVNSIAIGTGVGGVADYGAVSKTDEDTLKKLASSTGGEFFRAEDSEALARSFSNIVYSSQMPVSIDLSFYLMFASILLFSLNWLLQIFRFRIVP